MQNGKMRANKKMSGTWLKTTFYRETVYGGGPKAAFIEKQYMGIGKTLYFSGNSK